MPLPIEINHVLGKRSLTLEPRGVDSPATVGRSRECDVQIPSATVGSTHCMLFVHEGQWLLQESPDLIVTVNGEPIAGPVALQIGDVIGIGAGGAGANAPTIQIDPEGAVAGKTGAAREANMASRPSPTARSVSPAAPAARKIRPPKPTPIAGIAPPQLSAPSPVYENIESAPDESPPAAEAAGDSDTIDFGQPAASTAETYRRRPPQKSSEAGGLIALFLVVVVVLGCLILWAWSKYQANLAANKPQPVPVAVAPPAAPPPVIDNTPVGPNNSIFDIPGGKAKHYPPSPAPAPVPTPAPTPTAPQNPVVAAPPTAPPANVADDDEDPDWLAVLSAHAGNDPANALVKFDSYRQVDPDKHKAELAKFESDAIELLWWQRVQNLFDRRADLDKQMAAKRTDIADQPAGAFHNQLVADLADLQTKRNNADEKLKTDFAYTLSVRPDIDDRAFIAPLDAKRDPDKFAKWGKNTKVWILEHNGRPPWADE